MAIYKVNRRTGARKFVRKFAKNTLSKRVTQVAREVKKLKAANDSTLVDLDTPDMYSTGTIDRRDHSIPILQIAEGTNLSNRVGRSINVRSVLIDGSLASRTTQGTTHIALVQDLQQEGDTTPLYTEVFDTKHQLTSGGLRDIVRQRDQLSRFRVLWKKILRTSTPGQNNDSIYFRKYLKFKKPFRVDYNGSAATDIQKNGLYIMAYNDSQPANASPLLGWNARVKYDP